MNYGKIADAIAITLMVVGGVGAVVGVVVLWVGGAPLAASIPMSLLVLAVGALVLFAELDRRGA